LERRRTLRHEIESMSDKESNYQITIVIGYRSSQERNTQKAQNYKITTSIIDD
jgi:hypothetical protein